MDPPQPSPGENTQEFGLEDAITPPHGLSQSKLIKMHLTYIRTFQSQIATFAFFSNGHDTFSGIDHMLLHKTNLGKCKKIEVIKVSFLTLWEKTPQEIKSRRKLENSQKCGN